MYLIHYAAPWTKNLPLLLAAWRKFAKPPAPLSFHTLQSPPSKSKVKTAFRLDSNQRRQFSSLCLGVSSSSHSSHCHSLETKLVFRSCEFSSFSSLASPFNIQLHQKSEGFTRGWTRRLCVS